MIYSITRYLQLDTSNGTPSPIDRFRFKNASRDIIVTLEAGLGDDNDNNSVKMRSVCYGTIEVYYIMT